MLAADLNQSTLICHTRPLVCLIGLVSPDQNPDIDATAKSVLHGQVVDERADFCRMIHAEAARVGESTGLHTATHMFCTTRTWAWLQLHHEESPAVTIVALRL